MKSPSSDSSPDGLWRALAKDVDAYLSRRVEPDAVDDLRQEVFTRVVRSRQDVRDEQAIAAWVLRIAHNAVVDHLRKRTCGGHVQGDSEMDTVVDADEPDAALQAARVLGPWLRATIDTLPEPYAQALQLVELEGRPQRQAAQELGLSYSAFKSRVQRGRAQLRSALLRCCRIERDARGRVIDWAPHGVDPGQCSACDDCD